MLTRNPHIKQPTINTEDLAESELEANDKNLKKTTLKK